MCEQGFDLISLKVPAPPQLFEQEAKDESEVLNFDHKHKQKFFVCFIPKTRHDITPHAAMCNFI